MVVAPRPVVTAHSIVTPRSAVTPRSVVIPAFAGVTNCVWIGSGAFLRLEDERRWPERPRYSLSSPNGLSTSPGNMSVLGGEKNSTISQSSRYQTSCSTPPGMSTSDPASQVAFSPVENS